MGNITVSFHIQDWYLNTKEYMDITSKRKVINKLNQFLLIAKLCVG